MIRRSFLFISAMLLSLTATAQSNGFVLDVQKNKDGWGKIVVVQDARLTKLVNNDTIVAPEPKKEEKKADTTKQNAPAKAPDILEENAEAESPRPAKVRRYKVSGYRVQIYAGNNSRNSRIEAEKAAQQFKGYFPKVPTYTHFYPPRWVCRVGDFKTSEQAQAFMQQLRQLKVFSGLIVVKSAIQVAYRSDVEEQ